MIFFCFSAKSVLSEQASAGRMSELCRCGSSAELHSSVGGCVQNGAVCRYKENGEVNRETAMHLQDVKSVISQWCVRESLFSHCQCKTSYFYYHF